ncbi:MAG: beta-lactamase family protein [Saprospiraceae bacterium]|nr:beta-lactamase family protein [Saprospiraceae bacterium]
MNQLKYLIHTTILFLYYHLTFAQQLPEYERFRVDSVFESINRSDMPGCALAIVKDGKIVYERGYGMADLEQGIAITPQSVFYAGSISKQFVASCALLLSERNLLDLNAPVQQYLPDFPTYNEPITVRHLIHHISGIKDYFKLFEKEGINYLNQISREETYDLIKRQDALNFNPGDQYSYSNSGYLMLAMIIEKVSGISFAQFVDQEIFQPLGMKHSMFLDNASRMIPNRAWGYHCTTDGEVENMLMRFDLVGSGGLYTTVEDLYLWDQNFYNSKIGGKDFIAQLLTVGKLNNGENLKYAFAIVKDELIGHKLIGHSGSLGGYRAQFMQFPEDHLSIIILGNFSNFKPGERAHDIAKILFKSS